MKIGLHCCQCFLFFCGIGTGSQPEEMPEMDRERNPPTRSQRSRNLEIETYRSTVSPSWVAPALVSTSAQHKTRIRTYSPWFAAVSIATRPRPSDNCYFHCS
ncbi:hypothetical protein EDB83DRAFT_1183718 [Lactarius deliciosus]|nr:hypothetical protein EDB83DRAFT_1183718 [Lactarius deliciosus]